MAAAVSTALSGLDLAIVSTAMPTVAAQLGGLELYAWTFSAYLLTSTLAIPLYGALADRVGRKPMFLVASTIFVVGSAACGLAQSMPQLIAARFLQGAGGGGVYPLTLTIVGDRFETEARARLLGVLAAIWGIAALIGPAIGGFLSEQVSWRLAFFVQLPLAVLAMLLIALFLQEAPANAQAGGPRRFSRSVVLGAAAAFALGIPLYGQTAFVPQLLQGVQDASPTLAGLILSCTSLGWPVAANVCGRLVLRFGYRTPAVLGAALLVLAFIGLALIQPGTPLGLAAALNVLCGLGFGLLSPVLLLAMQNSVEWSERGLITGLNQFAQSLGGTLGVALAGTLFSAALAAGADLRTALSPAFATLIASAACALLVTALLPTRVPAAEPK